MITIYWTRFPRKILHLYASPITEVAPGNSSEPQPRALRLRARWCVPRSSPWPRCRRHRWPTYRHPSWAAAGHSSSRAGRIHGEFLFFGHLMNTGYVYTSMYIYAYVYIYIYVYIYTYRGYLSTCVRMYIYIYIPFTWYMCIYVWLKWGVSTAFDCLWKRDSYLDARDVKKKQHIANMTVLHECFCPM